MKNYNIYFFILILFISCNKNVKNQTSKKETLTSNGKINNKGVKIGWWTIFDKNKITYKLNFMSVSGKEYLNQKIKYDTNGEIIDGESNYFTFKIPDTLKIGKTKIDAFYNQNYSNKSDVFIYVGYSINKDFSNIKNVRINTFYVPDPKKGWFGLGYVSSGKKTIRGFIYEKKCKI